MVARVSAHHRSDACVRLCHRDLQMIDLALRVLLQSSTREEHIYEPIREAMAKIEEALGRLERLGEGA